MRVPLSTHSCSSYWLGTSAHKHYSYITVPGDWDLSCQIMQTITVDVCFSTPWVHLVSVCAAFYVRNLSIIAMEAVIDVGLFEQAYLSRCDRDLSSCQSRKTVFRHFLVIAWPHTTIRGPHMNSSLNTFRRWQLRRDQSQSPLSLAMSEQNLQNPSRVRWKATYFTFHDENIDMHVQHSSELGRADFIPSILSSVLSVVFQLTSERVSSMSWKFSPCRCCQQDIDFCIKCSSDDGNSYTIVSMMYHIMIRLSKVRLFILLIS